jgi:hypothetical protein
MKDTQKKIFCLESGDYDNPRFQAELPFPFFLAQMMKGSNKQDGVDSFVDNIYTIFIGQIYMYSDKNTIGTI